MGHSLLLCVLFHPTQTFFKRPGRDTIHLVTIVPVEVQRSAGQQLLEEYQKMAERSMIDVRADVVVSPGALPRVDVCMDDGCPV